MGRWCDDYSIQTESTRTLKLPPLVLLLSGSYFKRIRDGCFLTLCVAQVRGGFLAQPSCRSSPRTQLSLLTAVRWISDNFLGGLSARLATGRERLSCLALGEGSKVFLYRLLHLYATKALGPCVGNPSLSMERSPGSSGAPGVHAACLSPCRNVMHRWLVSFLPHTVSFVFLHHGAKAA